MNLAIPNCPQCQGPAIGTLETITGLALFGEIDPNGQTDYGGETRIWWDEQKTVYDKEGRATLVCCQGHDWQSAITEDEAPPIPGVVGHAPRRKKP